MAKSTTKKSPEAHLGDLVSSLILLPVSPMLAYKHMESCSSKEDKKK
jgi:hypothetical protein